MGSHHSSVRPIASNHNKHINNNTHNNTHNTHNNHNNDVAKHPNSLPHNIPRDDYDLERRLTLVLNAILRMRLSLQTIQFYLTDPAALMSFKKFLRKSVSAEEADMFVEVIKQAQVEETSNNRSNNSQNGNDDSIVRCFNAYLQSPHFTSWTAAIRANIVSFVTHNDELFPELMPHESSKKDVHSSQGSLRYKASRIGRNASSSLDMNKSAHFSTFSTEAVSLNSSTQSSARSHKANSHYYGNHSIYASMGLSLSEIEEYTGAIVTTFSDREYSRIVRSQSWLATLSVAAHCINVPITVLKRGGSKRNTSYPIVYCNPAFQRLTGRSRDQCIYQPGNFMTRVPEDLEGTVGAARNNPHDPCFSADDRDKFFRWMDDGTDINVCIQCISNSGKLTRVQFVTKSILDETKSPRYVVALYIPCKEGFGYDLDRPSSHVDSNTTSLVTDLISMKTKLLCEALLTPLASTMSTEC